MKELNLSAKNIKIYLKMLFVIVNAAAIVYFIVFLRENAYKAIVPDKDYIIAESQQINSDIETERLQEVVENFDKKLKKNDLKIEKNPF